MWQYSPLTGTGGPKYRQILTNINKRKDWRTETPYTEKIRKDWRIETPYTERIRKDWRILKHRIPKGSGRTDALKHRMSEETTD